MVSNVPAQGVNPFRIKPLGSIPLRDVPTLRDPQLQRPLIGMRALRRARLKVELDFASDTVSIWTP